MGDECIHGFEEGLCAVCFPPKEPEPAAETASRPKRAARAPRSPARAAAKTPARRAEKPQDIDALRIFHVTHVDNLARILGAGAILADTAGASPAVDLSSPEAREFRRSATVGAGEAVVADYVPFFLAADAPLWETVRTGSADARLAEGAVNRPAADYIVLVGSVAGAAGARADTRGAVIVADADLSAGGSPVASTPTEVDRALARLTRDEGIRSAELLVRERYPFERVTLIAVAHDRVRDRVKDALTAVGARTRVSVYPPWFQAGTTDDEV